MPNTFNYPFSDRTNPVGANELGALAMFYQRSLYKEAIYPTVWPSPLDTWQDKTLYGKIDTFQNTITLKNNKIRPVLSIQKERIYAADFVVEAFEAFAAHMLQASINGKLNTTTDGDLYNISAAEGWSCPHKTYSNYVENLFKGFMNYYVRKRHNQIIDFKSFIPIMKGFLKTSAKILPVTMSNALLISPVSPMVSGLSIKIGNLEAGDDNTKYQKFISNPNFDFYRMAAKKFGLIVNKNMPWILTADLFSNATMYYVNLKDPTTSKKSFFVDYYDLACLKDIDNFKKMFVNFYNQYIEVQPYFEKKTIASPNCPYKTNVTLVERISTTVNKLDTLMTDFDWIDFYIELREIEAGGTPLKRKYMKRIAREKYEISNTKLAGQTSKELGHVHDYTINTGGHGSATNWCVPTTSPEPHAALNLPTLNCHSHDIFGRIVLSGESKSRDYINGLEPHTHSIETASSSAITYINLIYRNYLYTASYMNNLLYTLTGGARGGTIGTSGASPGGSSGTSY